MRILNQIIKTFLRILKLVVGVLRKWFVLAGLWVIVALSFLNFVTAEAQTLNDINILGVKCFFPGQTNCGSGSNVFDIVVDFALNIAPFLAVMVIMWGGYKYLFSGLPGDMEDGKKTVINGVTGLIIVLTARAVVGVIRGVVSSGESGITLNAPFLGGQIDVISNFLFAVVGALSVAVIVWGGYKYLFSGLPGDMEDGKKSIQNGLIGLLVVLLARPVASLVQRTISSQGQGTEATLDLQSQPFLTAVRNIVSNFFIPLSSVIAVAFLVIGAYYLITARGDSERVTAGRNAIRNAVIGLIVVLLATTIVQLIIYFTPIENVPAQPSPSVTT